MATLVFESASGSVAQVQFGAADVAATLAIAQTAWGWIGGLDGIRWLLDSISWSFTKGPKGFFKLDEDLVLSPLTGQIFTINGPEPYHIQNNPAFGQDSRTRFIGLTLCALAHECSGQQAVHLFMTCLAPTIVKLGECTDALYGLLTDRYEQILNEGASRGLTKRFSDAVSKLNLPTGDRQWLRIKENSRANAFPPEFSMVGGLLRWIGQGDEGSRIYFTRSSLVARVAACLKAAGYMIGNIHAWNGVGDSPRPSHSRSVVLVLGGSQDTDLLMLSVDELFVERPWVHHYRYTTVGAMFSHALYNHCDISPERFQQIFERVDFHIKDHLRCVWSASREFLHGTKTTTIQVTGIWEQSTERADPIARKLAAYYFPFSADMLSFCYKSIANDQVCEKVRNTRKSKPLQHDQHDLVVFRAITASIIIAVTSRLAEEGFDEMMHSTLLNLISANVWLEPMCLCLDRLVSGLTMTEASGAVAAVHYAIHPGGNQDVNRKIIGWRNGIYAVVPSLLIVMTPTQDAIGLRCLDRFWAVCIVHEDGSVRNGSGSGIMEHPTLLEGLELGQSTALQSFCGPFLGRPLPGPPDLHLYLGIERTLHYQSRDLCLRGRVNGESVGSTTVIDILDVLIRSLDIKQNCPGHAHKLDVINVRTSTWIAEPSLKPVGGDYNTYIPVQGDRCWALFLAGQTAYYDGHILFGCPDCVGPNLEKGSALIGYS